MTHIPRQQDQARRNQQAEPPKLGNAVAILPDINGGCGPLNGLPYPPLQDRSAYKSYDGNGENQSPGHDRENLCAADYLPRTSRGERLDGKEQDIL